VIDNKGNTYTGDTFADLITTEGAETLAKYNSGWYTPYSAVTVNNYGRGKAYYIGCGLSQDFYNSLIEELLSEYSLKDIVFPEDVEVNIREKDGKKLIFVNNFSDKEVIIEVKKPIYELIREETIQGDIKLSPFGIMILEEEPG
jgi:beta-galactosidase